MGANDGTDRLDRLGRLGRVSGLAASVAAPTTERDRERRRIVALCTPFLVLVTVAGAVPLWELVRISVSEATYVSEGFTLVAYERVLFDPRYRAVAVNSLWFATATTLGSLLVAVPVAHALEKYDLPAERWWLTVLSFPVSLPGIVAAFMIIVLFGNTGVVTGALVAVTGADPTGLAVATGVLGLFFAYLYSMVPRALLLLRGAYAEVNADAEEAARSLGAGPLRTFYHVTLPGIRAGVVGASLLLFRTALAIFGTVLVLQAMKVWTLQLSRELTPNFNVQTAAAMALVWFAFIFAVTVLGLRYTSAEVGL